MMRNARFRSQNAVAAFIVLKLVTPGMTSRLKIVNLSSGASVWKTPENCGELKITVPDGGASAGENGDDPAIIAPGFDGTCTVASDETGLLAVPIRVPMKLGFALPAAVNALMLTWR